MNHRRDGIMYIFLPFVCSKMKVLQVGTMSQFDSFHHYIFKCLVHHSILNLGKPCYIILWYLYIKNGLKFSDPAHAKGIVSTNVFM